MKRNFARRPPQDPLAQGSGMLASRQQDFPVVDENIVIGVLTRTDLLTALAKRGDLATASHVMQRNFQPADPAEMIDVVLQRLQRHNCQTVPFYSREG